MKTHAYLFITVIMSFTLFHDSSLATIVRVDPGGGGDALTIQQGITLTSDGDTLLIQPGLYLEDELLVDRSILIRGSSVEWPVIDGEGAGGIFHVVWPKSPSFRNLVLRNADWGIRSRLEGSDCSGAASNWYADSIVVFSMKGNGLIADNQSCSVGSVAWHNITAISCREAAFRVNDYGIVTASHLVALRCSVGVDASYYTSASFECAVFWQNTVNFGGVHPVSIGNLISYDPLICDTLGGNFGVASNSVCLPENNDCASLIGAKGFECEDNASDRIFALPVNYMVGTYPSSVCAADLDGDGDIDLAISNENSVNVSIFKNSNEEGFGTAVNYPVGSRPYCICTADFDNDGDSDLATASWGVDRASILMNDGTGAFAAPANYPVGTDPLSVCAADFDGDGDYDLAVSNHTSNNVSVLKNNGSGGFSAPVNTGVGGRAYWICTADFDGDGDFDLAVAVCSADWISILMNDGTGSFSLDANYATAGYPACVHVADFDGNGIPDLAVACAANKTAILINDGNGTFESAVHYWVGLSPLCVYAADYDLDGDLDLAVANVNSNNLSVLKNYGDGTFAVAVNHGTGTGPKSVCAADFDADGDPDLAVVNCVTGDLSILMNTSIDIGGYGSLAGTVTDAEDETPIPEANVVLLLGEAVIETAITDETGNYEFQMIPAGTYALRITKDDYRAYEQFDISIVKNDVTYKNVGLIYDWQFSIHIDPYGYSTDPTNILRIRIEISNQRERSAINVAVSVLADGEQVGSTMIFPELHNNQCYSFDRTRTVPKEWPSKSIACNVVSVNGLDVNVEESILVSVIYPVGADGEPFNIETDAYSFSVTDNSWSIWDNFTECDAGISLIKSFAYAVGLCFGMASSSAAYFENPSLKPISCPTSEMNNTNEEVMNAIEQYHLYQADIMIDILAQSRVTNIQDEMNIMETLMRSEKVPVVYLCPIVRLPFKKNVPTHTVTAYRITKNMSDQTAKIKIYENLYENQVLSDRYQFIEIDITSAEPVNYKAWKEFVVFETAHIEESTDLCDLITNTSTEIISNLYDNDILSFFHLCPVTSIVSDNYGRNIGFVDSVTFINEIPDAKLEVSQISETDSALFYSLPLNFEYTATYSGQNEGYLRSYIILPTGQSTAIIRGHDEIAIQSGLVGTLDISTASEYVMELDYDNNGTIDEYIPPTIDNIAPTAPKLLSPMSGNNISGQYPEYVWTESIDIDGDSLSYHFSLASDDLFQTIITDTIVSDTILQSTEELQEGEYYWKVIAQDARGLEKQCPSIGYFVSIITSAEIPNPPSQLTQSYPNPFNPRTTITYTLGSQYRVLLAIYDISGKLVKVLVDDVCPAGTHNTAWDGCDEKGNQVASGVYFCRMKSGLFNDSKKLVLIR